MSDETAWFAPKRYGYGSGLPISWQGWLVMIGYLLIVTGLALALRHRGAVTVIAALILPTSAFSVICARGRREAAGAGAGATTATNRQKGRAAG